VSTETAHVDTFVIDGLPPLEQWPEISFERGGLSYPDRMNAATDLLDNAIDRGWGDRPCTALGDINWTYSQLLDQANRIAEVLVNNAGVVPGNRVLLRGPNAPWMVAAWFGCLKAGAVAVATMPMLRAVELSKIHAKCSPTVAICEVGDEGPVLEAGGVPVLTWGTDGTLSSAMEAASGSFDNVDTAATDPALLGFTSGTTGEPKAAIHFHRDVSVVADVFVPLLDVGPHDIFVGSAPLAFTFGLGGHIIFPMSVGASTVYCETPGPGPLAELIADRGATVCFTAPTAWRAMMLADPSPDLSSLRVGVSAGETLPAATFELVENTLGVRLVDGLGATELLHIFLACGPDEAIPGKTGKPLKAFEAKLIGDDGNELGDGQVGRLAVRGPIGCRYLNDERQKVYVQDGWNVTGDSYIRDADGYYQYQARSDDMIISSGYNIAAPEVEAAVIQHPAVAEVGVIGSPDEARGRIVHAFICLNSGYEPTDELAKEIQNHVKATVAPYKYPRRITFSAEPLPKTNTGKLQRNRLG